MLRFKTAEESGSVDNLFNKTGVLFFVNYKKLKTFLE